MSKTSQWGQRLNTCSSSSLGNCCLVRLKTKDAFGKEHVRIGSCFSIKSNAASEVRDTLREPNRYNIMSSKSSTTTPLADDYFISGHLTLTKESDRYETRSWSLHLISNNDRDREGMPSPGVYMSRLEVPLLSAAEPKAGRDLMSRDLLEMQMQGQAIPRKTRESFSSPNCAFRLTSRCHCSRSRLTKQNLQRRHLPSSRNRWSGRSLRCHHDAPSIAPQRSKSTVKRSEKRTRRNSGNYRVLFENGWKSVVTKLVRGRRGGGSGCGSRCEA